MATLAREVFRDAATLLQDRGFVRWKLPEMRIWLNAGLREIALRKPNAKTSRRRITLDVGTLQAAPAGTLGALSIVRNMSGPVLGGAAIRMVSRADMDAQDPDWQDATIYAPQRVVRHAVIEATDPRAFYVWPPNDGTGRVEILTADIPRPVSQPAARDDWSQYSDTIDIGDEYVNALTDYVVYRCYAKDIQAAANAQRAALAFRQFADALGVKTSMEIATTPSEGNAP